jgi:hypothetical protein
MRPGSSLRHRNFNENAKGLNSLRRYRPHERAQARWSTLAAAPQAMVTATRRMSKYRIAQSNVASLMKVPETSRRPFASRRITSL